MHEWLKFVRLYYRLEFEKAARRFLEAVGGNDENGNDEGEIDLFA